MCLQSAEPRRDDNEKQGMRVVVDDSDREVDEVRKAKLQADERRRDVTR